MKKTLHIDEKLLQEARTVSRAAKDTETVRLGLEALIRRAAYERSSRSARNRSCRARRAEASRRIIA
jgi:hypothetical protein